MPMAQQFRHYDDVSPQVRTFYAENHARQTYAFAGEKAAEYGTLDRRNMSLWEALLCLDRLFDSSDPDTEFSQLQHLLQTAERIRAAGHPDWFILTGLIHDLGKMLCLFGEPQWAVVGDSFPLGCAFDEAIIFPELFDTNPDSTDPIYSSRHGIYEPHCGLKQVRMSWGHDEYLYLVVRDYLPPEALAIVRYHSFYSAHQHGAYAHLMDEHDQQMFRWVRAFQPFDLYSKTAQPVSAESVRPYYRDLVGRYFPQTISW